MQFIPATKGAFQSVTREVGGEGHSKFLICGINGSRIKITQIKKAKLTFGFPITYRFNQTN